MADVSISIRDDVLEWVESRVAEGRFESIGDYLGELARRDRDDNDDDAMARLRAAIEIGRRSGISKRSLSDIIRDHMSARDAA